MEFLELLGKLLLQILRFWMDHLLFINVLLSIVIVFFERGSLTLLFQPYNF